MAKEFVERETLLDVIKNNVAPMYYKDCLECIVEAPAADVVEVKRGHWKMEKRKNLWGEYMDAIVCSECGGISQHGLKTKYCSRCGAEMEGMD